MDASNNTSLGPCFTTYPWSYGKGDSILSWATKINIHNTHDNKTYQPPHPKKNPSLDFHLFSPKKIFHKSPKLLCKSWRRPTTSVGSRSLPRDLQKSTPFRFLPVFSLGKAWSSKARKIGVSENWRKTTQTNQPLAIRKRYKPPKTPSFCSTTFLSQLERAWNR